MSREFVTKHCNNPSDGGMRNSHVGLAPCQHWSASKIVDKQDGGNGHHKIDDADHTGREERNSVSGQTNLRENGRGVVNNGVDTKLALESTIHDSHILPCPLLQTLSQRTQHQSVQQSLLREQALVVVHCDLPAELLGPVSLLGSLSLNHPLRLECAKLVLHLWVVLDFVSQSRKGGETLLLAS